MTATLPERLPVSTYRLQLTPAFGFREAAALLPYLARLGITECYCSPILAARPGSPHGYDTCDHGRLNPELGGEAGFAALAEAAQAHGLGMLVDFVPNHMSTDPAANRWWRSVLESGPSSPFARYFDIDWTPVKPELHDRILLPVLGDQYGVTLEQGALRIEGHQGGFRLRYYDLDLPLNPRQLRRLLEHDLEALRQTLAPDDPDLTEFLSVVFHLEHLPPFTETRTAMVAERQREKDVALGRLAALADRSDPIHAHLRRNIEAFNGRVGEPASFDLLHGLLEAQPYRLATWRTAMHEINYRRFFDVNELAGLRMEEPEVFAAAHALMARLVREGAVTGLRLDHVDGLYDPEQYLRDLAALVGPAPLWTVVEKILMEGERLDSRWQAHGTTGYDFLNHLNALFVDPARAATFESLYAGFVGHPRALADVVYESKKVIITTSMASELNVLAHELNRISESHRRSRDFTLDSLREALREVVACFPVYRTYYRGETRSPFDRTAVDRAVAEALRRNPAGEPTIFQFIREMLLPLPSPDLDAAEQARRLRFALKFQQYAGPVQAKGMEDTAFYRYGPLLSLNEVGGDPARFGHPPAVFHAASAERLRDWPLSLSATATHDTKRGEDARARLNVLSEIPTRWRTILGRWSRITAPARTIVAGRATPDPAEAYLFYQALLGAWPPGLEGAPPAAFVLRMQAFMRKAMREAKVHTSWINPSGAHEDAVLAFVHQVLAGPVASRFCRSVALFAAHLARLGVANSLSQLLLKLGAPGVADFYQGAELWDLSLVDPDNRGPVAYDRRRELVEELGPLVTAAAAGEPVGEAVGDLYRHWPDGRIKFLVTLAGLGLRRRLAPVFLQGEYLPVTAEGEARDHVVAFGRRGPEARVLVLATRLVSGLTGDGAREPVGQAAWGETLVRWPGPQSVPAVWRDVLTGESLHTEDGSIRMADACRILPVSLLVEQSRPDTRSSLSRELMR